LKGQLEGRVSGICISATNPALYGDREKFLAVGMDEYIAKPIGKGVLQQTLKRIAR